MEASSERKLREFCSPGHRSFVRKTEKVDQMHQMSRCYKDSDVNLETNTMANWMMRATEIHLNILYEELLKELITSSLIHADETPFEVIRDGRSSGAKSYMWVYCTGESEKHPVILYDYRSTRKADHPKEFLRNSKKPLPHRV